MRSSIASSSSSTARESAFTLLPARSRVSTSTPSSPSETCQWLNRNPSNTTCSHYHRCGIIGRGASAVNDLETHGALRLNRAASGPTIERDLAGYGMELRNGEVG